MDYWLIFQSLIKDIITWEGTTMDRDSVKVNLTFNQQDSLGRQIHQGVYSSCDKSVLLREHGLS